MRYCWSHNAYIGQRGQDAAPRSTTSSTTASPTRRGNGNYEIESPNGGTTYIIGNLIHQGANSTNGTIITYGAEGADQRRPAPVRGQQHHRQQPRRLGTVRQQLRPAANALVQNNIFQGVGTPIYNNNATRRPPTGSPPTPTWRTPANYDYHLTASSTGAINAGTAPGTGINGFNMNPIQQYVHPLSYESRPVVSTIDIGCYEYGTPRPCRPCSSVPPPPAARRSTTAVTIPVTLSASSDQHRHRQLRRHRRHRHRRRHRLHPRQRCADLQPRRDHPEHPRHHQQRHAWTRMTRRSSSACPAPANATLGTPTSHTYTIIETMTPADGAVQQRHFQRREATTAVNLTVTLSAASGKTVTVNTAVTGGTATNGTDYTISGTQPDLHGRPDQQERSRSRSPTTRRSRSNETIIVALNSPSNATLGTTTQPHLHHQRQRPDQRAVRQHQLQRQPSPPRRLP